MSSSPPGIPELTGRKIGEYEITARIGVGGMGVVYEGIQPLIGKRVAVKVLLPSLSNEKELVERFLAEARAVNEIRHRGIVDIFSFGQLPEGSHYFVMEYLQGEPFDKIIKTRAPLSISETLTWADEMLDALDSAHSAGIVHRDIKPSNLFLVNTGRGRPYVKLLDFGIAKLGVLQGEATPQTRASVILGTPDYISPEQARGRPISPQTDLYALGCVLFEMLTGDRVFIGENTLQTMWMHVEDPPPSPSTIRPELPQEIDDLILWALQKDPANRPPSAAAFRDSVAQVRNQLALTGQMTPPPKTGSTPGPLSHTPPPSGRNRSVGTPAPRSGSQAPLRTPSPGKSGTQSTIAGRGPSESQRTRLSPLTAISGVAPMHEPPAVEETRLTPPRRDADEALPAGASAPKPQASSKLALILAGVVALLVGALAVLYVVSLPKDETPPTQVVIPPPVVVEAPKPAPPVIVEKPPEEKPVVVDVKPEVPVEAPKPPPVTVKKGISPEMLSAKLKKLEAAVSKHDAEIGQRDNVMHQYLDQARKQVSAASTDGDRREALQFLNEIQGQLK